MLEALPPEGRGGAWVGLAWLAVSLLRKVGLRASKDMITLNADAADREAIATLRRRINELDTRLHDLETARNQMFGFTTKCMAYIAQCQCAGVAPPTKGELQAEFEALIRALADGFHRPPPPEEND